MEGHVEQEANQEDDHLLKLCEGIAVSVGHAYFQKSVECSRDSKAGQSCINLNHLYSLFQTVLDQHMRSQPVFLCPQEGGSSLLQVV